MFHISADGKRWSDTGRCGYGHPLPDGTAAECDPDGESPCCNDIWDGECGNTTQHCSCWGCIDYNFTKWWRESGGKQMWRNDGKCGFYHRLPNNKQAECDPDGERPCCGWDGVCSNTTEHCSCENCVDYRQLYRDWRKTEGKQKWRYDEGCGTSFPLPDGTAAQCDPDGKKPCCSAHSGGRCRDRDSVFFCHCERCLDYGLVKQVTRSGTNCTVARLSSGFLKYVCYDEIRKQLTFKCTHSDVYYKSDITFGETTFTNMRNFSMLCKNDPYSYQPCGFGTQITNTKVLCGGYICGKGEKEEEFDFKYNYIECSGDNCKIENRENCTTSIEPSTVCDDKCDNFGYCDDEGDCNGYRYGVTCFVNGRWTRHPAAAVCFPEPFCDDGAGKRDLPRDCAKNTGHACTHYATKKVLNMTMNVPLLNYTRCSVFKVEGFMVEDTVPYCLNYRDQTNCSDIERVGGYCEVGGFLASVSKFVVCYEYDQWFKVPVKICDDNLQNDCVSDLSPGCTIHKHRICDGEKDCSDGRDEVNDICMMMH